MTRRLFRLLSLLLHPEVLRPAVVNGQLVAWCVALCSDGSFNPAVPYHLFGVRVPHQLGSSAVALALLSIPVTGVATLVFLGSPALERRSTRRQNPRAGLCVRCGYDLRATPGRCPECGAEPKGATA